MHELAHEFTNRNVSPWGGLKLFQQVYERSKVKEKLQEAGLPQPGSNRGYDAEELVEGFMTSVIVGARRLEHSGMLRTDSVIQEIFGWKKGMASASTFSRFFRRFDVDMNDAVFPPLMKHMMSLMAVKKRTIDIDSTVITRYGHQQEAMVGYNPSKKGRRSHHPLMAFCAETKMVVNAWMRSGDSASSTDMKDFLAELFAIVPREDVGLIRADAGFYADEILRELELENKVVRYIVKADKTKLLVRHILRVDKWYHSDTVCKDACYTEFQYKASTWKSSRRMIVVRVPKKNTESDKLAAQSELFQDIVKLEQFEYMAFVTNSEDSAVEIHSRYNKRGECENRIKELKYDYAIDGFALQQFPAMEAAFRFIMIAFNLMQIFKQSVMTSKRIHQLKTVRFQCIAIGSYLVTRGRIKTLMLSAKGKRRHFLDHLFERIGNSEAPFEFSIA